MPSQRTTERFCAHCGARFIAKLSQIEKGGGLFCSISCTGRGHRKWDESGRICSTCQEWKPREAFTQDVKRLGGMYPHCRACHSANRRSRYAEDPERYLLLTRRTRAAHPERSRKWDREKYQRNLDVNRARRRAYYEENRESCIQRIMHYQRAHPAMVALHMLKRKARGGHIGTRDWLELCEHYGNVCLACGRSPVTIDHVVPLARGGLHDISNVQPLCKPCNSRKGTKTIDYRPDRQTREAAE